MADKTFAVSVAKFAKKAKLAPSLVVRKTAIDMLSSVIRMSPVDTGTFRGNWHIAKGVLDKNVLNGTDMDGGRTLLAGVTALGDLKPGETVFIINNLPYSIPLEYGHSKQAPAGMVRITVKQFREFLSKAVKALEAEK